MNTSLRQPPKLKKGDTIGILSTARKISKEEITHAIDFIESNGFQVQTGKSIGAEYHQFAGNDKLRLNDLQEMINDNSISAILCARGGYGTVRIIDRIDFSRFMGSPKWIAGYSDVTALHMLLNTKLGIQSLHSPMATKFQDLTDTAKSSLIDALTASPLKYSFKGHKLNKSGNCEGILIGGNLSVLYSLSGTGNGGIPARSLLFIEDVDEYLYHVDRMMMNFQRGNKLENLNGLIVGGMTYMNDNEIPFGKNAEDIISEHIEDKGYPVCYGFPAGHITDNRTLVLGKLARLSVSPDACEFVQSDQLANWFMSSAEFTS